MPTAEAATVATRDDFMASWQTVSLSSSKLTEMSGSELSTGVYGMPIVAISGGEIGTGETRAIDEFIVELSGKRAPQALFVPTASGDSTGYAATFTEVYGTKLGCDVATLNLLSGQGSEDMRSMVEAADIIYVGGGDTKLLIDTWTTSGFSDLMIRAWERSKVLCGISAGGMCWFSGGFSDYQSIDSETGERRYAPIGCLGIVDGVFCPHLDSENRLLPLVQYIADSNERAFAGMDGTALVVEGKELSVVRVRDTAWMYNVQAAGDTVEVAKMRARTLA